MADKNELPEDAVPEGYGREYSEVDFWQKLKNYAVQAGAGVIELSLQLYFAAADPTTPRWARLAIIAALGYFVSPIDAVPDLIPGIGYVDDLGVLTAAVATVATSITPEHRTKAREKMKAFFGRDDDRVG
jgi:uncharacterized membrane protein YkvA (DUF1232 family)